MSRSDSPPGPFEDRHKELKAISDSLERLDKGKSVYHSVLNFYGIPRIGKTALLEEIQRRKTSAHPVALTDLRKLAPALSFAGTPASSERSPENLLPHRRAATILEDQVKQLKTEWARTREFDRALDRFRRVPYPQDTEPDSWHIFTENASDVARAFVAYVHDLAEQRQRPAVLLFDSVDDAQLAVRRWLEKEVFFHLASRGRTLVVVAGRKPAAWEEIQVLRRTRRIKLLEPAEEDTMIGIPPGPWRSIERLIVKLTSNYPPSNEAVVKELETIVCDNHIGPETWKHYESSLASCIVKDVLDDFLLAHMPREMQRALELCSPLRRFDADILREILPPLDLIFNGWGSQGFIDLVQQMKDTALVDQIPGEEIYEMDPTVRRLMMHKLSTPSGGTQAQIHREAARSYRTTLSAMNKKTNTIEWLYHMLHIFHVGTPLEGDVQTTLVSEFEQILDEFYQDAHASVRSLLKDFGRDQELINLLMEDHDRFINAIKNKFPEIGDWGE
ncbi:MAG: ATP-binding protein [Anaerolineae bacterium]|nr:ATP-binding protein [Anaerolineae bacterium]